jgi:hypothetical protein
MKRTQHLVLDLETVLDTSLPPPPKKKDGSEAFPAPPFHRDRRHGRGAAELVHRGRAA